MSAFSRITGSQPAQAVQADATALAVQNAKLTEKLVAKDTQHADLMYANSQLLKSAKYVALSFGAISLAMIGYAIYMNYKGGNGPSPSAPSAAPQLPPPIVVPPATI